MGGIVPRGPSQPHDGRRAPPPIPSLSVEIRAVL